MFVDLISDMQWKNGMEKSIFVEMARTYENHLPESLYLNQYQLDQNFGYSPVKWKEFLKIKEIDVLIESEIAGIAEIGARRALQRLESGLANSADIQAARELLANSKLLKQKTNARPLVVLTRIPQKELVHE